MHPVLDTIQTELEVIAQQIESVIPYSEPLSLATGTWTIAGVTKNELAQSARTIRARILDEGLDDLVENVEALTNFPRRLEFFRSHTLPQLNGGNAVHALPAYLFTLGVLKDLLEPNFIPKKNLEQDTAAAAKTLKKSVGQLRGLEARLSQLQPRTDAISDKIELIDRAHEAADQLPTDLQSLAEARQQVENLLNASTTDQKTIEAYKVAVSALADKIQASSKEAEAVIKRCNEAYSAVTSQGLASAFTERSKTLTRSMQIWVGGFVAALVVGSWLGSQQLHNLSEVMRVPDPHWGMIWLNLLLSLLSIGAPIWFGWMAAKQIGHRFRLAEDYAFKASISQAYEGYRREALLIDPALAERLFSSALSRLDELPLRLVEATTHGSPWHELASSDLVRRALDSVPGFTNMVTDLAKSGLATVAPRKTNSQTAASAEEQ